MTLQVSCPGCQKKYEVADHLAGTKAKCQACGQVIAIPQPQSQTLQVVCGGCNTQHSVSSAVAGKAARCTTCGGVVHVPAANAHQQPAPIDRIANPLAGDPLAAAVAMSSGLQGDPLRSPVWSATGNRASNSGQRKKLAFIIGGVGGLALLAMLVLVLILFRGNDPHHPGNAPSSQSRSGDRIAGNPNQPRDLKPAETNGSTVKRGEVNGNTGNRDSVSADSSLTWSVRTDGPAVTQAYLDRPLKFEGGLPKTTRFTPSAVGEAVMQFISKGQNEIRRYNLINGQQLSAQPMEPGTKLQDFRPDGKVWLTRNGGELHLWQCQDGQDARWLSKSINLSPSEDYYQSGALVGEELLLVADRRAKKLFAYRIPEFKQVYSVDWHPSSPFIFSANRKLVVASQNRELWLLDTKTGRQLGRLETEGHGSGEIIECGAFSGDGNKLAVCVRGFIGVWNLSTGQLVNAIRLPAKSISWCITSVTLPMGWGHQRQLPANRSLVSLMDSNSPNPHFLGRSNWFHVALPSMSMALKKPRSFHHIKIASAANCVVK